MAANLERRAENLAFCFQEVITVGERLRANRQAVTDANSFRQQIRAALQSGTPRRGSAATRLKIFNWRSTLWSAFWTNRF